MHLADQHLAPTIILLTATLAYLVMHYGLNPEKLGAKAHGVASDQAAGWFRFRLAGGALLGSTALITPLCLKISTGEVGFTWAWSPLSTGLLTAVIAVVLPILFLQSRSSNHREHYPQIRLESWHTRDHLLNAGTWIFYLVGYEAFFRGFLLLGLRDYMGDWPALAVTTALYTAVHIVKPAGEGFGSLFMGIVFALTALESNSILGPLVAHGFIAISNDFFAIWHSSRAMNENAGA